MYVLYFGKSSTDISNSTEKIISLLARARTHKRINFFIGGLPEYSHSYFVTKNYNLVHCCQEHKNKFLSYRIVYAWQEQ